MALFSCGAALSPSARTRLGLGLCGALLCCLGVGCAGEAPKVADVRKLLRQGKLAEACAGAEDLAEHRRAQRGPRLEALRLWIGCMNRGGRIAEVQAKLAEAKDDGGARYGRGLALLAAEPKRLPEALRLLRSAAQAWPEEGEIRYRAGIILLADARPKEAVAELEVGCKRLPTARCSAALAHGLLDLGREAEARRELGKILDRSPRPRDIARGRQLIRRLLRRHQRIPDKARKLFMAAQRKLLQKDNAASALANLRELAIDYPNLGPAHTLRGLAHLRLGNLAQAVAAFGLAAKGSVDARNHYYLGVIYRARRQPDAAIRHYQRALALDPFLWRAAAQLGRLLGARGRHKEAASLLDRLVILAPSHVARRMAGRASMQAGDLERAEKHFRKLLAREPRDFEAHLRLAQILLRLNREGPAARRASALQDAREHAAEAASLRPTDPEVKLLLQRIRGR